MFRRMNPPPDRRHSTRPVRQRCSWLVFLAAFLALLSAGSIRADDKETTPDAALPELVKVVYFPHRFRFAGYDANPKKPAGPEVQIHITDGKKRHVLLVDNDIPGSNFQIKSFKKLLDAGNDVSEITILNKDNGALTVLSFSKVMDSPSVCAIFRCKGVQPDGKPIPDFTKRPGDTFTLPPGSGKTFKVLSIDGQQVIIELPDGTNKTLAVPK